MAEVTSYTAEAIEEKLALLQQVAEEQAAASSKIAEMRAELETAMNQLLELNQISIPELNQSVGGANAATSDVVENQIPNLEQAIDDQRLLTLQAIPKVFRQPEPPTNEDDPERELQIEDKWVDTDDSDKEYHWDGTAWVESGMAVADFSLTARKFLSSAHLIY